MFWARAREKYGAVTADDADIRKYAEVSDQLQQDGYRGLVGQIQDLGHRWIAARTPPGQVLEIGAGTGRHSRFLRGNPNRFVITEYSARNFSAAPFPGAHSASYVRCDARRLPFADASFDAVISIYNLEHITNLSVVLREVRRVLRRDGAFLVALPCEGGLAWNLGRELTTRRTYGRKYGINYDKVIAFEHVWDFEGVRKQLEQSGLFNLRTASFLPFGIPTPHVNLVACMELCVRPEIDTPS